jgi:predicted DNA-binding protein (MmcQ/YjbR family)
LYGTAVSIRLASDYPFDLLTDSPSAWTVMRHNVNRKDFAHIYMAGDKPIINLKLNPIETDFLRQGFESINPAWYMNKEHWFGVDPNSDLPVEMLRALIEKSYELTMPRRKKRSKNTMKRHFIEMPNLKTEEIHEIDLVLENCEGIKVYHNEIVEVNLEFEDELTICGSCIERRVKSGYIKLRIEEKTKRYMGDLLIHDNGGDLIKKPHKQKIEGRLLELCNICYIRVTEQETHWTEQIDVPFEMEEFGEDDYGNTKDRITICPSAKLDADGNLVILFGESSEFEQLDLEAETLDDFVKRWERYTEEELQAISKMNGIPYCLANTRKELIDELASYFHNIYKEIND